MPWASKTHTFSPSTVAKSAEVNDNFDDMVDQLNIACPSGLIALWSGSIASIPSGWYLCDGNNSTPDLRDKFVAGAGSSYAVGDTGGEATHVLTIAEMPVHDHVVTGGTAGGSGHVRRDALNNSNHTTNPSGSGSAHENRPPYYALAYIMKS
jgi:microcystin-dependent protein